MKFYVSRTSDGNYTEEKKPTDNCTPEEYSYVQAIYDGSKESRNRTVWAIEISSLEVLMDLMEKEGDLVLRARDACYGHGPRIIIYDDYLE